MNGPMPGRLLPDCTCPDDCDCDGRLRCDDRAGQTDRYCELPRGHGGWHVALNHRWAAAAEGGWLVGGRVDIRERPFLPPPNPGVYSKKTNKRPPDA